MAVVRFAVDGRYQFVPLYGVGAQFADDDAGSQIGEAGGVGQPDAGGEGRRQYRGHRVAGAGDVEYFLGGGGYVHIFVIAEDAETFFRAGDDDGGDVVPLPDFIGQGLDRLIVVDGLRPGRFAQFFEVGRDVWRAGVFPPVGAFGVDDERHAGGGAFLDRMLAEPRGAEAFGVVGQDDGPDLAGPDGLADIVFQAGPGLAAERSAVFEIEPQHLLVAAQHSELGGGGPPVGEQAAAVDTGVGQQLIQPLPAFVLADNAGKQDPAAETGEVIGHVAGAAEGGVLVGDAGDRHGRLGRDALDFAEVVAVEHDVADDEDGDVADAFLQQFPYLATIVKHCLYSSSTS